MKATRQPYKRGAKQFLAMMEVGQTCHDDGRFNWRGVQAIASRLEKDLNYEVEYRFSKKGNDKIVTRVR
jgi:hypothetical protein